MTSDQPGSANHIPALEPLEGSPFLRHCAGSAERRARPNIEHEQYPVDSEINPKDTVDCVGDAYQNARFQSSPSTVGRALGKPLLCAPTSCASRRPTPIIIQPS